MVLLGQVLVSESLGAESMNVEELDAFLKVLLGCSSRWRQGGDRILF